jgi:oligoendopeptidase F
MFDTFPQSTDAVRDWSWSQFEPYFQDLITRHLDATSSTSWLADWTRLSELLNELRTRLYIGTTVDTTDKDAERRFFAYLDNIFQPMETANQKLKEKLLASGIQPQGFEIQLRDMRADAELFRAENLPLFAEDEKLGNEYDKIIGAQTVQWEGEEVTLLQLEPIYQDVDRAVRERAWRLASERRLADRDALDNLWQRFMDLRRRIATNAGYSDYRAFRWVQLKRFDYNPADCETFHNAIAEAVVPAASRIYERRRQKLGVESLRPWDLNVDPLSRPPLRPFKNVDELESKAEAIFKRVDSQLGDYFTTMRREKLLDLDNRKGKAPGGYQIDLQLTKRPFIFMNAVGIHDDVQTLLHEGGHAFHCFESVRLPYYHQREFGTEMAEVASMSMELLAAPYLAEKEGGYYSEADAARARIEKLEEMVLFWPYMAVVDAFQHWVYTHHDAATDPANCDAQWAELWARFMLGVDWSGLDDEMVTGWQRKLHIFQVPFYYVDYGLAQLGSVQVWKQALENQSEAIERYRQALALGGTRSLPELYAAAGARFAFDTATVSEAIDLIERTLVELEAI